MSSWLFSLVLVFSFVYIFDHAWKVAAIWHFFRQKPAPTPDPWPTLSLIQPVTAGPNDLMRVLAIRAQNPYPGKLQQIIICDEGDSVSLTGCMSLMQQFPNWQPELVLVPSSNGTAAKTVKQLAGLKTATGKVLCFIDDDILLRPDTLSSLVLHLQPGIGATFGLACYINWQTVWGGLMSAFVNANALLNYIPLTYLTQPYTITGHIYALKKADFDTAGGLSGMEARLDDDHELARRVTRSGLLNRQTPAIYDVDNELSTLRSFLDQMKRWFVFPKKMMLPYVPLQQKFLTIATSLPNLLPGLVLAGSFGGNLFSWLALSTCLLVFFGVYFYCERSILKTQTPAWAGPLLLLVLLVLPFQILFVLFSDNVILWRGKRYRVRTGGEYELID